MFAFVRFGGRHRSETAGRTRRLRTTRTTPFKNSLLTPQVVIQLNPDFAPKQRRCVLGVIRRSFWPMHLTLRQHLLEARSFESALSTAVAYGRALLGEGNRGLDGGADAPKLTVSGKTGSAGDLERRGVRMASLRELGPGAGGASEAPGAVSEQEPSRYVALVLNPRALNEATWRDLRGVLEVLEAPLTKRNSVDGVSLKSIGARFAENGFASPTATGPSGFELLMFVREQAARLAGSGSSPEAGAGASIFSDASPTAAKAISARSAPPSLVQVSSIECYFDGAFAQKVEMKMRISRTRNPDTPTALRDAAAHAHWRSRRFSVGDHTGRS